MKINIALTYCVESILSIFKLSTLCNFFYQMYYLAWKQNLRLCYILAGFLSSFYFFTFYCLWYYSCPNYSAYTPSTEPTPPFHNQPPHHRPCPWVLHICSLTKPLTFFQSVPTSPQPLQLSVCSTFPCVWFYFAH